MRPQFNEPHAVNRNLQAMLNERSRVGGREMAVRNYYERYWASGGLADGIHHETYPELRQLLEAHITPTADCLDIGCGNGKTCGTWLKGHAGSYVGVDIAPNIVQQAQALGLDAHIIDDATSLPFADNSFDLAVCTEVLEH